MRLVRLLLSIAMIGLLVAAVTGARGKSTSVFDASRCSASALSAPFTGALRVSAVASYACQENWAYLWATIGLGEHAVGVTEVLHFDSASNRWRISSRARVCRPGVMPGFIYRQGCFSN
ncbi:MAG TPA: hypothetical protein VGE75_02550 [Acidimicrobiales bacterium]